MDWFISRGNGQEGPYKIEYIRELVKSGSLLPSHHVWQPGMSSWVQASEVAGILAPPPIPPENNVNAVVNSVEHNHNTGPFPHPVRPWIRFWARTVDTYIYAISFGVLLGALTPSLFESKFSEFLIGFIVIFSWCFVEAFLLSMFRTTPGKWLLNITVTSLNPEAFDYQRTLTRAISVWYRGLGCGIPLIAMFTQILAYKRLKDHGKTTWDNDYGYIVRHGDIGIARFLGVAFFLIIASVILSSSR